MFQVFFLIMQFSYLQTRMIFGRHEKNSEGQYRFLQKSLVEKCFTLFDDYFCEKTFSLVLDSPLF